VLETVFVEKMDQLRDDRSSKMLLKIGHFVLNDAVLNNKISKNK